MTYSVIAMGNNSEIPCSACHQWNAKAKSFSCNPNKCKKLSEWLLDNAQLANEETVQIKVQVPIQYVI